MALHPFIGTALPLALAGSTFGAILPVSTAAHMTCDQVALRAACIA